jgi:Holliday junction resolvasome RuvABC endonuclease subunit|tara:strand:- start:3538 stop:3861 length:324 start_codon:yes stop_codon:yes gene_type:complete
MKTATDIIEEMTNRVKKNEAISPASWIESATRVSLLSEDLDNQIAHHEAQLIEIEAEYLKADMSSAKAKTLAKSEINYKEYLELKARFKRINEWILLAKRRAVVQDI